MNNTLSKIFLFAAGVAVGSAVTWKLVKTKYEQIAQEEIDSIREVYNKMEPADENETENDNSDFEKQNEAYQRIVTEAGYAGDTRFDTYDGKEEEEDMSEPYVISPEEFDTIGYETVSLYWFEDGVVTDVISSEVIENVEDLIGEDFADHFGEYEDDSVHIRNDALKTDFEVLRDGRNYSEVS